MGVYDFLRFPSFSSRSTRVHDFMTCDSVGVHDFLSMLRFCFVDRIVVAKQQVAMLTGRQDCACLFDVILRHKNGHLPKAVERKPVNRPHCFTAGAGRDPVSMECRDDRLGVDSPGRPDQFDFPWQ
jgi:hypothetical protein